MDALLEALRANHDEGQTLSWIEDEFPEPDRISVNMVRRAVADHFGMTVHDLVSDVRTKEEVLARHVGMYLAQVMTRRCHEHIARCFGRADHSMSIYANRKIKSMLKAGSPIWEDIEQIKTRLLVASASGKASHEAGNDREQFGRTA